MHASAWDFIIGSMEYVCQVSVHGIGMVVSLRLEGSSGRGQVQFCTNFATRKVALGYLMAEDNFWQFLMMLPKLNSYVEN